MSTCRGAVVRARRARLVLLLAAASGASACIDGAVPIGGDHPDKVALSEIEAACEAHCDRRRADDCADDGCEAACAAQFERVTPCEAELAALLACASPRADASSEACPIRAATDDACRNTESALAACLDERDPSSADARLGVACDEAAHCECRVDDVAIGSCDPIVDSSALASASFGCCAPIFGDRLDR